MIASLTNCCDAVHVPKHRVRHCNTLLTASALYSHGLRQRQPSSWVLKIQARRPNRDCTQRAAQVIAFVGTGSASAGSGVSFLFAASTSYCIPLYALVSTSKCCCNTKQTTGGYVSLRDSCGASDAVLATTPSDLEHDALRLDLCASLSHVRHSVAAKLDS